MSRLQRIRVDDEISTSTSKDDIPGKKVAEGTAPDWLPAPTTRRPAYERFGTIWRKLLGDPSFLDVVAKQGIDGE